MAITKADKRELDQLRYRRSDFTLKPDEIESLRRQYRPMAMSLLLVGESVPAGGTFFYKADSYLYEHTHEGFAAVFGDACGTDKQFLQFFKQCGCYLDDLSPTPVNDLDDPDRILARQLGIPGLAERLRAYRPNAIVVVMKQIISEVDHAVRLAALEAVPRYSLPFPVRWPKNIERFVTGLADILRNHVQVDGERIR